MNKMSVLIAIIGMMISPNLQLQAQKIVANDVVGVWMNEEKDAHIKIFKDGDKFFGKLVWTKESIDPETGKPKLDKHNPDPELKKRPSLGMMLLTNFIFDDDEWDDGSIYDPKNGKTYSCYMEFTDESDLNRLKIRGYVGISLLGRTTYWTRVKQ